ncbi:MAG: 50S ribosomal protein L3 [bacterium]
MELLIGKKLGMTHVFEESGELTPVSVIQAGPCPIVQVKTEETDGYSSIQIGFEEAKEQRVSKPMRGHFKRGGVEPCRILKEVRVDDPSQYKIGDKLDVKLFEGAGLVHVAGVSKGKGFAGTIRRHSFQSGPKAHGSKNIREPGSVGMCATPSRILKGKRLPGRMGGKRITVRNLKLVQIDAENNLLYIRGAVPGAANGIVYIQKA